MEDIWLTSNCNNRFEVSSLSRLCCVLHSWTFWGGLALLSLLEHFHKVSVCCLVGKRKNASTKKSFIWLFSVCFSSSVSEASKIFPPIDGPWRIFLTLSLNVYLRISCIFFFFLNFWINKWMRAKSLYSWNSLFRVVVRRFDWLWWAGPPAGPAWSGGGSAGEAPACQPKPGSQMMEGGRRPLSSYRDRVSSNKQNHTDTWGEVKTWVFCIFSRVLECNTGPPIYLPASLE